MDERLEKIRISSKFSSSIWETIDDGWYLCKASYIDRLINNGTIEITDESDQYKAKIEELQNRVSELEQMLSGVNTYEYALEKYGEQIIENYSEHKRLETCKNNLIEARKARQHNKLVLQAQVLRLILLGEINIVIADKLGIGERTVYSYIKALDYFECENLINSFKEVFDSVSEKNMKLFKSCNYNIKAYRTKFKSVSGVVIPQPTEIEPPQEIEKPDNQPVIEETPQIIEPSEPVEPPQPVEPPKQVSGGVSIDDILKIQDDFQEELAREQENKKRMERQKKEEQATQGKYLDYYTDRMAFLKKHKLLPYDENYNFSQQEPVYEEMEF